ncbi:MAG: L-threonylcarbamoyladenylate synthase [Deltaproteobacteria bacterium]|nr:L-threonylcarbamoyladenylate synthase [Deltaproteobacteria bacterium]MBW2361603.1 L-threonylcarbamoyladenylate synthase [Deltaproteobacteria bacterium]
MSLADPLGDAARWVAAGGLLAYPTETLWALGADASSQVAVERLRRWKGRAADASISLLVADADQAEALGLPLAGVARRLARAFWPGPLTLVVRATTGFAEGIANREGAVGVRCSPHPLAGALARRMTREGCGPLTATSLNRAGAAPAATWAQARTECGEEPDAPRLVDIDGAEAGGAAVSTVIDATCEPPRVLRWGAIAASELKPVLGAWSEA